MRLLKIIKKDFPLIFYRIQQRSQNGKSHSIPSKKLRQNQCSKIFSGVKNSTEKRQKHEVCD